MQNENNDMKKITAAMKASSPAMAASSEEMRNQALRGCAKSLEANKERIFEANRVDMDNALASGVPGAVRKRLLFDEKKLHDVTAGIDQLISLPDPLGKVLLHREMDEGLVMKKVTCPIGVIGVIFEARPDALVQISSLCIKSGNCAILKGGRETENTNRVLFEIMSEAAVAAGLPEKCLVQARTHSEIDELLGCDESVDLLIPRGSNAFVRYIMDHTRIPVMGHADGICHIFVDAEADTELALTVIADAKTQYPAACNAVETVLIDRRIAGEFLPALKKWAEKDHVELFADKEAAAVLNCPVIEGEEFRKEYGDLKMSVALADGVEEAVRHINTYGSHHTDCIITENDETAAYFTAMTDSAGVYRNISTRFADGFRYGFGAEVGISTGKIHARGPVGLDGLVTYKYRISGKGHIVGDYASGRASFHFRDIPLDEHFLT